MILVILIHEVQHSPNSWQQNMKPLEMHTSTTFTTLSPALKNPMTVSVVKILTDGKTVFPMKLVVLHKELVIE